MARLNQRDFGQLVSAIQLVKPLEANQLWNQLIGSYGQSTILADRTGIELFNKLQTLNQKCNQIVFRQGSIQLTLDQMYQLGSQKAQQCDFAGANQCFEIVSRFAAIYDGNSVAQLVASMTQNYSLVMQVNGLKQQLGQIDDALYRFPIELLLQYAFSSFQNGEFSSFLSVYGILFSRQNEINPETVNKLKQMATQAHQSRKK